MSNLGRLSFLVLGMTLIVLNIYVIHIYQERNELSDRTIVLTKQVEILYEQLWNAQDNVTNLQKEVQELRDKEEAYKNSILEHQKTIKRMTEEIQRIKEEKKQVKPIASRGSTKVAKEFFVVATAYTAYCNGCSGITKTGINLRQNPHLKVIAVDPSVIPLGSKVHVEGYGYAIAGDIGGAIKGYKIDVFIASRSDALRWGRKKVKIKIIDVN